MPLLKGRAQRSQNTRVSFSLTVSQGIDVGHARGLTFVIVALVIIAVVLVRAGCRAHAAAREKESVIEGTFSRTVETKVQPTPKITVRMCSQMWL